MSHNGVRKRLKVRWMMQDSGDSHAFLILRGGTLKDWALCGLPLQNMAFWHPAKGEGGKFARPQCALCEQAMSKGGRA